LADAVQLGGESDNAFAKKLANLLVAPGFCPVSDRSFRHENTAQKGGATKNRKLPDAPPPNASWAATIWRP